MLLPDRTTTRHASRWNNGRTDPQLRHFTDHLLRDIGYNRGLDSRPARTGASARVFRKARTALLAIAYLAAGAWVSPADANPFYDGLVPAVAKAEAASDRRQTAQFKRARIMTFRNSFAPGTVVVETRTNRLLYVLNSKAAAVYAVATAKTGFEWKGAHRVSRKAKWPDWRPPQQMRVRKPDLPDFMEGGPDNPLGARAIYLGSSIYRIHGTNEPTSIGKATSSGCIRMLNDDVSELYQHVKLGTLVVVM